MRIAAGEVDSGIRPYRELVELGQVDILQPDLGHCGGFTIARQIAVLAREHGVEVVPHCFSTGILVAASLHYAASLDHPTYSEFSITPSPLASGVIMEPFKLEDGYMAVPTGPGLGVELDEDIICRYRLD